MGRRTALHQRHMDLGGRMVDFAGWHMPLHYGSQIAEHHTVRNEAGIFDVSHMTVVDLSGEDSHRFLRILLANDVTKLTAAGQALYGCMLNEQGGVLDDLITYLRDETNYRLVVNAATREADLAWIGTRAADYRVAVTERADLAMLAVQGPRAMDAICRVLPALAADVRALKPFTAIEQGGYFIARTGYTGEDGCELMLDNDDAADLFQSLLDAGASPVGLGARDTLRLEAGLNLYGSDMDDQVTPLESGLAWTVAWEPTDRDFIGRQALSTQREDGLTTKRVGLLLDAKGVLRGGQKVYAEGGEGVVTSGTFSPTLKRAIALARVPLQTEGMVEVEVRDRRLPAKVVRPPFAKSGQSCIELG